MALEDSEQVELKRRKIVATQRIDFNRKSKGGLTRHQDRRVANPIL